MIDKLLTAVQTRLLELTPSQVAYVAEDWGQLDFYTDRPPVNFPCVLIDAAEAEYSDLSMRIQRCEGTLTVRIADTPPINCSAQAPNSGEQFRLLRVVSAICAKLHGFAPEGFSRLSRISMRRTPREDTIKEYAITFRYACTDQTAYVEPKTIKGGTLHIDVVTK